MAVVHVRQGPDHPPSRTTLTRPLSAGYPPRYNIGKAACAAAARPAGRGHPCCPWGPRPSGHCRSCSCRRRCRSPSADTSRPGPRRGRTRRAGCRPGPDRRSQSSRCQGNSQDDLLVSLLKADALAPGGVLHAEVPALAARDPEANAVLGGQHAVRVEPGAPSPQRTASTSTRSPMGSGAGVTGSSVGSGWFVGLGVSTGVGSGAWVATAVALGDGSAASLDDRGACDPPVDDAPPQATTQITRAKTAGPAQRRFTAYSLPTTQDPRETPRGGESFRRLAARTARRLPAPNAGTPAYGCSMGMYGGAITIREPPATPRRSTMNEPRTIAPDEDPVCGMTVDIAQARAKGLVREDATRCAASTRSAARAASSSSATTRRPSSGPTTSPRCRAGRRPRRSPDRAPDGRCTRFLRRRQPWSPPGSPPSHS